MVVCTHEGVAGGRSLGPSGFRGALTGLWERSSVGHGQEGHHHHHHDHGVAPHGRIQRRLLLALVLTLGFVGFEAAAGFRAHSLALLTDAAHNLTDVAALALSFFAVHLAGRPAHANKTYGYHRMGILAALINASTLGFIAVGICVEAVKRFDAPAPVEADLMMTVGAAALIVNLVTAWLVSHGSEEDLNLRSAFLHLLGDVLSNVGAIAAGIGIFMTGLNWLDPLVSVLMAVLILFSVIRMIGEAFDILMEATPADIDVDDLIRDLMQTEGVMGLHDLHVWSLSRQHRFFSAHVMVEDMPVSESAVLRDQLTAMMAEHYRITHTTLQFETEGVCSQGLYCDIGLRPHAGRGAAVILNKIPILGQDGPESQ